MKFELFGWELEMKNLGKRWLGGSDLNIKLLIFFFLFLDFLFSSGKFVKGETLEKIKSVKEPTVKFLHRSVLLEEDGLKMQISDSTKEIFSCLCILAINEKLVGYLLLPLKERFRFHKMIVKEKKVFKVIEKKRKGRF